MKIHYDFGATDGDIDSAYFWVAIENEVNPELQIIYESTGKDAIPKILRYALLSPSICEKLIRKDYKLD